MSVQMNTVPATHVVSLGVGGQISLEHNGRDFFVVDSNHLKSSVSRFNLSKELRGISSDELQKALSVGYLAVSKAGEEYVVRFNARMAGGGPFLAAIAYVGSTVAGGALVVVGMATAPIGVGGPLMAAGATLIGAAPVIAAIAAASPTL